MAMRWIGFAAAILIWWLATVSGVIDSVFLSTPQDVAREFFEVCQNGEVGRNFLSSSTRTILGFIIGSVAGVFGGILIGCSTTIRATCEGVIDFLRSIPVVALFPLFVAILGIGDVSKVAGAAWAAFPIVVINVMHGVATMNRTRKEWLFLSGIRGWNMVRLSLLWEICPSVVTGLRAAFSASLIMVVVSEMFFGTTSGMGRMIYDASVVYQVSRMYVGIVVIGLFGFIVNIGFRWIERRIVSWR